MLDLAGYAATVNETYRTPGMRSKATREYSVKARPKARTRNSQIPPLQNGPTKRAGSFPARDAGLPNQLKYLSFAKLPGITAGFCPGLRRGKL